MGTRNGKYWDECKGSTGQSMPVLAVRMTVSRFFAVLCCLSLICNECCNELILAGMNVFY